MNESNRHFHGCSVKGSPSLTQSALLLLMFAALNLVACGGGGGSASDPLAAPNTVKPTTPPVRGTGKVIVTVRDVFQVPVAGAKIYLLTYWTDSDQEAVADANGRGEFQNVPESFSIQVVSEPLPANGSLNLYGLSSEHTVSAGEVKQVVVTASPSQIPDGGINAKSVATGTTLASLTAGGIAAATVAAGGISDDGQTMDLTLKVIQVRHPSQGEYPYGPESLTVLPCTPGTSTDPVAQRSACISGADEFDAPYDEGRIVSTAIAPGPSEGPAPYSAALLLNQSASVIIDDPTDARLFAAKYFLTYASTSSPKLLAAFASDDPATNRFSLLPQQPVTLFPVENPQYTSNGPDYYPTVDALNAVEGGAEPLYSALDQLLDVAAANASDSVKAVVVISDGRDDTCGSRAECRAIRDAVIRKSRATDVAIVTIGVPSSDGEVDHETLGLLAQSTPRGASFWAEGSEQLAMTVSSAHSYLALQKNLMEVNIQIHSPVAGAFVSGRNVLGTIQLAECPWDCYYSSIPFVVQVP